MNQVEFQEHLLAYKKHVMTIFSGLLNVRVFESEIYY